MSTEFKREKLPEDDYERKYFDRGTKELYNGDSLANILHCLKIWSYSAPGSFGKVCAIIHNELMEMEDKNEPSH